MRGKRAALAAAGDWLWQWQPSRHLLRWRGLLVLNYHRVGDPRQCQLDTGVFSATVEQFAEQMAYLSRFANVLSLADVIDGRHLRDRRSVLITFDDGYRDNYTNAYRVLQDQGLPAVFFVTTGFIGSRSLTWWDEIAWRSARLPKHLPGARPLAAEYLARYKAAAPGMETAVLDELRALNPCDVPINLTSDLWMSWEMVVQLHAAGMTIGGHTASHPILSHLSPEKQDDEIRGCAAQITERIGSAPLAFSYPVGGRHDFDTTTKKCLERAGFQLGFSFYGGWNPARERIDRWDIRRAAVETGLSAAEFRLGVQIPSLNRARPAK